MKGEIMGTSIYAIVQIKKNGKWEFVPELPNAFKDRDYNLFAAISGERDSFGSKVFEPKGLPTDIGALKYNFCSYSDRARERYENESQVMCVLPDGTLLKPYDSSIKRVISEEEYNHLYALFKQKSPEYQNRYSHLGKVSDRDGIEYIVYDADELDGVMKMCPFKEIFETFEDFLKEYYEDDWDEDAQDYGEWKVDFESEDYCSKSYLTLKELQEGDYKEYTANKYKMLKNFYDTFIAAGGTFPEMFSFQESSVGDIKDAFQEAIMPTITVCWQMTDEEKKDLPLFKGIKDLEDIAKKYSIENPEDIRVIFEFDY